MVFSGCLQQCTVPLLADTRLQTQCTGSQGGPQPLGKCADPAEQFQRVVSKELWGQFLPDWLAQGQAPAACAELVELQEEDSQAWQRQVYLMVSHLDASEQENVFQLWWELTELVGLGPMHSVGQCMLS